MIDLSPQDGFVFYQHPTSDEIYFLSGTWKKIVLNKQTNLIGFIISNADKSTVYFLEGSSTAISSHYRIKTTTNAPQNQELNQKQYINKVQLFIDACKEGVNKVILSRIKKHKTIKEKNLFDNYINLCKSYEHSFNYLFNIPEVGMWMGATPEILIQGSQDNYKTVALAGSKPQDNIVWNQKELEEQQYVTNYIKEKLNKATISHHNNPSPETVLAGNIAHLKTTFTIQSKKTPIELSNLLHPTPAVCGLPQKKALDFILTNEGYNREFYTGFLGPINGAKCDLFVNLRCMQVFKNENWLYVGGGITSDSNPIEEWQETELKAQTLLNILD